MITKRFKVDIHPPELQDRAGQAINLADAIVYDFMPTNLGNAFRTDDILKKMLLRPSPVNGPFMAQIDAYKSLGAQYLATGDITPALECYRLVLSNRIQFSTGMYIIQKNILLDANEIKHLGTSTGLEGALRPHIICADREITAHTLWVDELRTARKEWLDLNHNDYGSKEYVEACLRIGRYEEAHTNAKRLDDEGLVERIELARPEEILDVTRLQSMVVNNTSESSFR